MYIRKSFLTKRHHYTVLQIPNPMYNFIVPYLVIGRHPPNDMTYFSTASASCDLRRGDPGWFIMFVLSPPLIKFIYHLIDHAQSIRKLSSLFMSLYWDLVGWRRNISISYTMWQYIAVLVYLAIFSFCVARFLSILTLFFAVSSSRVTFPSGTDCPPPILAASRSSLQYKRFLRAAFTLILLLYLFPSYRRRKRNAATPCFFSSSCPPCTVQAAVFVSSCPLSFCPTYTHIPFRIAHSHTHPAVQHARSLMVHFRIIPNCYDNTISWYPHQLRFLQL